MYPNLEINIKDINSNLSKLNDLCKKNDIELSLVTKVLVGDKKVVELLIKNGISSICDSRIQNLMEYKELNVEKWLIREPMLSEIEDVVRYSDISLNSELETVKKLNEECKKQNKKHKVILMYELGDLREGANKEEVESLVEEILKLENIELYGIGANLSCYGAIMPGTENMNELSEVAKEIESKFNINLQVVSGGNSSSVEMLKNNGLPKKINNLRMGEAVYFGNIPCIEKKIEDFNYNNFILNTQIVEIKNKKSIPWGERGISNSFCEIPHFEDKGIRKRAIVAIGKQDIYLDGLTPTDSKIEVLGGSSDYVILDITDSETNYKVGDIISFNINYPNLLSIMRR